MSNVWLRLQLTLRSGAISSSVLLLLIRFLYAYSGTRNCSMYTSFSINLRERKPWLCWFLGIFCSPLPLALWETMPRHFLRLWSNWVSLSDSNCWRNRLFPCLKKWSFKLRVLKIPLIVKVGSVGHPDYSYYREIKTGSRKKAVTIKDVSIVLPVP